MRNQKVLGAITLISLFGLGACASTPSDPGDGQTTSRGQWTVATEEEVAAKLDKELFEAVKGLVFLKKDGELKFCKRYKDIGSSIATIKCINEAQLRTRVENMARYREDMRNKAGKCTRGRSGGPPCGGGV